MMLRDRYQDLSQTEDEDKAESIIDKLERRSLNIPGMLQNRITSLNTELLSIINEFMYSRIFIRC